MIDTDCVLCGAGTDNCQHLFFECSFSAAVWKTVLGRFGITRIPQQWSNELIWLRASCKGRNVRSCLIRQIFATTVYKVWGERNCRVFCEGSTSAQGIAARIIRTIALLNTV